MDRNELIQEHNRANLNSDFDENLYKDRNKSDEERKPMVPN